MMNDFCTNWKSKEKEWMEKGRGKKEGKKKRKKGKVNLCDLINEIIFSKGLINVTKKKKKEKIFATSGVF